MVGCIVVICHRLGTGMALATTTFFFFYFGCCIEVLWRDGPDRHCQLNPRGHCPSYACGDIPLSCRGGGGGGHARIALAAVDQKMRCSMNRKIWGDMADAVVVDSGGGGDDAAAASAARGERPSVPSSCEYKREEDTIAT